MALVLNGIKFIAMKINKIYIVLAFLGVALSLGACSDEWDEFGSYKKNTGDEIVFSGRAGFEMDSKSAKAATTRTVYTGTTYTEGGKTFERVNWVKGDQIRVYCPEAAMMKVADYTVTAQNTGVVDTKNNYHATTLERVGDASLQWGNTSSEHNFYAVYPSPLQYNGTANNNDVFNGSTSEIIGVIPSAQIHKGIVTTANAVNNSDFATQTVNGQTYQTGIPSKGSLHVVTPDMKYAYMVARTHIDSPDAMGDVFLNFMPIATAVEITLRNVAFKENTSADIDLTGVVISSSDVDASGNPLPVAGGFKADLSTIGLNSDGYGNTYPTSVEVVPSNKIASSTTVSVPLYANGTKGDPLKLKFGDAVTFTVFVLPTQDINKLNVTINGIQGSHTGTFTGVKVEKHKKTYLKQVPITGDVLPFDFSNWIRWIDDNVLVRRLSIPGSGGSATYNLSEGGTTTVGTSSVKHNNVRQQSLSIAQQWDAGVRCFEFSVDLNGTNANNSLGASKVICSGIQMNVKLEEAVAAVRERLNAHPHEFAMVIITYETSGGWSGTRNPATFMSQLNKYWKTVSSVKSDVTTTNGKITVQTALYDPSTATVGASRGKLFCIARPTSIHLDYGDDVMLDVTVVGSKKTDGTGGYQKTGLTNAQLESHCTQKIDRPNLDCHEHVLLIHGWGTLKDKWQQRGFTKYSVRRTVCNDPSTWSTRYHEGHYNSYNKATNGADDVKKWLWTYTAYSPEMTAKGVAGNKDGKPGRPFDTSQMTKANSGVSWNGSKWSGTFPYPDLYQIDTTQLQPDFSYETSSGIAAWVQEWARVSNAGTNNNDAFSLSFPNNTSKKYAVYWANSYGEKLQRVKECLAYAQDRTKGDIVYINSLCGYFITNDYEESIYPCTFTDAAVNWFWSELFSLSSSSVTAGMGGDIAGFAAQINTDFYNHLLNVDTDYEAGSMGIVLIDRVGEGTGGSNIPGVIIANNFQFDIDIEKNATMGLYDEGNDEAQFAPARRGAEDSDEEEVTFTWE